MESAIFNNSKVYAFEFLRQSGELKCECCNTEVIFKKGEILRPHFAHKTNITCLYKENESDEHIEIKNSIFQSLRKYKFIENLEMEKFLGDCISDVYFEKNGLKYAVEIQLSDLTQAKIKERNLKYKEKGIHVLWVHSFQRFLSRVDLHKKIVKLKAYERWLSAMNYGHLYLWRRGEIILPVSMKKTSVHAVRKLESKPERNLALDFFGIKKDEFGDFPSLFIMNFRK